ncbi:MAG TPA: MFS transporter [Pyrinomonadaceae bacterium]|nr:MFS transporter [Pyrinomonadaceae bacterium]
MSATVISMRLRADRSKSYRLTAAYFAAFAALGLTTGSLGPTLTSLAEQTHVGLRAISYVFTARSVGYVLGSVRGGKLFDRRAGNPVLAAMLVMMSIAMALIPLTSRLWLLLLGMFVLGAAEAGVDVGANTLLGWVHGNRVGPFMNAMHSFFGVGALLAPIVVAQTALLNYPTSHSYFVLALLLLPAAAFTLYLPSPIATTPKNHAGPATTNGRMVFLIALFLFLYVGAEVGFAGWIVTYAIKLKLSGDTTATYLASLFWGSLTLGRILTIPAAARFRSRTILMISLAGCFLSLVVLWLRHDSFSATLVGTAGLGLSMASIFPTILSFAGKQMKLTGRVTGWFVFGASAGAMLVPLGIGQAFQVVGPRVVLLVTSATLLVAVGVFAAMIRNPKFVENNS